MNKYIIYNNKSSNSKFERYLKKLVKVVGEDAIIFNSMEKFSGNPHGFKDFFSTLSDDDEVTLMGGDGTLNYLINDLRGYVPSFPLYFSPAGTGNDFVNDEKQYLKDNRIRINEFIKDLPVATINGNEYIFINNIGYGIDGYCCEEADKIQAKNKKKKVNYAKIALKGLLGGFKFRTGTLKVDGKEYYFKKVLMIPTMNGRYFGGGMMVTPMQDRLNKEHTVSVCVVHDITKLKALLIFPKIFKGTHEKAKKYVSFYTGKNIEVSYTTPTPLQVDGETIRNVLSYSVKVKQ